MKIYIKSALILIFLISIFDTVQAQKVPGYMGKRLIVGIDTKSALKVSNSWNAGENGSLEISFLSFEQSVGIDYILSRLHTIGLDYTFNRVGLQPVRYRSSSGEYLYSHNAYLQQIGIRFKHFPSKRGPIAPIGFYRQYRVFLMNYYTEYVGNSFYFGDSDVRIPNGRGNTVGFSFSYGHQGVIVKDWMYNIGVELSINGPTSFFSDVNPFFSFKLGVLFPAL